MTDALKKKLTTLPSDPGVYFHKAENGEVIYVGKAANLRNRVRQYFQSSRSRDVKTDVLVGEIYDTDWVTVETELDALFLESEMIKRYKPRYNILLRDDKSQIYVRINMKDPYPYVCFTRGPLDDGAEYFGPYYNGVPIKKALRYLRRVFPYSVHEVMPKRVCLQYHLGLCPGVEEQKISSKEYKDTLKKLIRYLSGERRAIVREIELDMQKAAKAHDFERAALLRNRLNDLKQLQRQIIFGDREFMDLSKDQGLAGLQTLLGLTHVPHRIEGYDISHMSGTNNVASMVVATNGLADKAQYRKFKLLIPGNNDFAHMNEALTRRFSGRHTDWPTPNLLLIDGGKGQLGAALDALEAKGLKIPAVGLAKREEEIIVHVSRSNVRVNVAADAQQIGNQRVSAYNHGEIDPGLITESDQFIVIKLAKSSHIVKLLQRIRDESHRFAVSYHSTLKLKSATASVLDNIPGVGPVTRKKLIATFGSGRAVIEATEAQLVATLGQKAGANVYNWLHTKKT